MRIRQCEISTCQRSMEKLRTGRGYILMTEHQVLAGEGPAEECQNCGATYCASCYPRRQNTCNRCGLARLKLIQVRYLIGQPIVVAADQVSGTNTADVGWAVHLRQYLATNEPVNLDKAINALADRCESDRVPPGFVTRVLRMAHPHADRRTLGVLRALRDDDIPAVVNAVRTARISQARQGRKLEAKTLELLELELQIKAGEAYLCAPNGMQAEALQNGLLACAEAARVAGLIGDRIAEAAYLTRLGNGLWSAGRLPEAGQVFERALGLWRNVVAGTPREQYVAMVGKTLRHLGNVWHTSNDLSRAALAYREAIGILRPLDNFRYELSAALQNAGGFHSSRNEHELAKGMFEESAGLLEKIAHTGTASLPSALGSLPPPEFDYARTLVSLGETLCSLGDFQRAQMEIRKAISIHSSLTWLGPGPIWPKLALARVQLGAALFGQWYADYNNDVRTTSDSLLVDAQRELEAALQIYKKLPEGLEFTDQVTLSMLNLGIVLGWRGERPIASELLREAASRADRTGAWYHRAVAMDALRVVQMLESGDPIAGLEYAQAAVQTLEAGLSTLPVSERAHRDLYKVSFR